MPEFQSRIEVLLVLNYIDTDRTVLLKVFIQPNFLLIFNVLVDLFYLPLLLLLLILLLLYMYYVYVYVYVYI